MRISLQLLLYSATKHEPSLKTIFCDGPPSRVFSSWGSALANFGDVLAWFSATHLGITMRDHFLGRFVVSHKVFGVTKMVGWLEK